jgi:DNA-binding GntR family transcriptional regulator
MGIDRQPNREEPTLTKATGAAADPRLYMKITQDLRDKITRGDLKAGVTVIIADISRQWGGTCRNTVSRALRALEDEGLLKRYPSVGYLVQPPETPASPAPSHENGAVAVDQQQAPETRDTITGTARLSDRDEAAAQAVARRIAALLKPDLAEIRRRLDIINAKLDEMRAPTTRHQEQHATGSRKAAAE